MRPENHLCGMVWPLFRHSKLKRLRHGLAAFRHSKNKFCGVIWHRHLRSLSPHAGAQMNHVFGRPLDPFPAPRAHTSDGLRTCAHPFIKSAQRPTLRPTQLTSKMTVSCPLPGICRAVRAPLCRPPHTQTLAHTAPSPSARRRTPNARHPCVYAGKRCVHVGSNNAPTPTGQKPKHSPLVPCVVWRRVESGGGVERRETATSGKSRR